MWQYWVTFSGTNQTSCYTKGLGECVTRKPAFFVSEGDVELWMDSIVCWLRFWCGKCGRTCPALFGNLMLFLPLVADSANLFCQNCFFLMSWMFFCWLLPVSVFKALWGSKDVWVLTIDLQLAVSLSLLFLYEPVCAWTDFNCICHLIIFRHLYCFILLVANKDLRPRACIYNRDVVITRHWF